MRICIVQSAYKDANSVFEKHDDLGDPSRYLSSDEYQFEHRFITKVSYREDIDKICQENFDMYMNWMWGNYNDNVAGIEAIEYLESKGVPVLATSAESLRKTYAKTQFYACAREKGLLVPSMDSDRYPKIVKYHDTCGSVGLDYKSVCYSQEATETKVKELQEALPQNEVVVQDYISGTEVSVMVIEMGSHAVAMTPLEYVFPKDTKAEHAFLTWHNKWYACEDGTIKYALMIEDTPRKQAVQQAALKAFDVLAAKGTGWLRVDIRLQESTGDAYVIEVNPMPVVFYPVGNLLGDDLVVGETFPGGHTAFFDTMVATKRMQMGFDTVAQETAAKIYDDWGQNYHDWIITQNHYHYQERLVSNSKYDYSGKILDLACGSGVWGKALKKAGVKATIQGVDVASGLSSLVGNDLYTDIAIAPLQNYVMGPVSCDHVVCFGAMHFLDRATFRAVLARMFMIAQRSITISMDDLDERYIKEFSAWADGKWSNTNLIATFRDFPIPKIWKVGLEEHLPAYVSKHFGRQIYTYLVRLERVG